MTDVEFTVYGSAAPQGSKRAVGRRANGSTIMIEMSAKVKPWRAAVKEAALEAYSGPTITDAVALYVTFTMKAPAKIPKGRTHPSTAPDLSKLIRSTEDAITESGLWRDDALVVVVTAQKLYPGQVGALDRPGAQIRISTIGAMTDGQRALLWGHGPSANGVRR
jgi:Holliday junction resolvase RusA-like endonuclease